jgi:Ser/Thr protein kinase RdoA (MazF antagonist)
MHCSVFYRPITRKLHINYLGLKAYSAIESYLSEPQKAEVKKAIESAEQTFKQLEKNRAPQGILSGDINLQNFHVTEHGEITLFDFDQCGWGYRVFDIAKFKSSLYREENPETIFQHFLNGYESISPLSIIERTAIDNLETLAIIWVMAIHVWNEDIVGKEKLGPNYWDAQVGRLISRK